MAEFEVSLGYSELEGSLTSKTLSQKEKKSPQCHLPKPYMALTKPFYFSASVSQFSQL